MQSEPTEFSNQPGVFQQIAPGVRCVIAPNASPMTYWGTNTYVLGDQDLTVIDPGPDNEDHLETLLNGLTGDQRITQIIVTHSHKDHSPLARALSQETAAPVFAFGDATAGRSEVMEALAKTGDVGGGEGLDEVFQPDERLMHGARLPSELGPLEVWHTPGHIGNHICLALGDMLFTGDHVMGWASSLVSPPDGDLTDFMASCRMLQQKTWGLFLPGHGAPIEKPMGRLDWLIKHREAREAEILNALKRSGATAREIALEIYTDIPRDLLGAAARNVLAHLIDLTGRDLVTPVQGIDSQSIFKLR